MRVLIAGCGYVGTTLGTALANAGHQVWGLRRNAHNSLFPPIHPLAADLVGPDLAERIPQVDRVVYAAAADASTPEAYRAAYVDGVWNLQAALSELDGPADRFVFVSSTAVYGDAAGGWVDEDTPTKPNHFRGELVLEGEDLVRSGPLTGIVVRLGGIYGPGRTRLLESVRDGTARIPEGPPIWSNRIHRDDAAGALAHVLTLDHPDEVYLGVDDHPAPLSDVYRFVAERLDVPPPELDPEARRLRSNKRCSNRRLRSSGYDFRFPTFREGYAAVIAEWGREG